MPTIYTVEIDGTTYDLEGDHQPSEAEARAAIGPAPQSTPPPGAATADMMPQSTEAGDPQSPYEEAVSWATRLSQGAPGSIPLIGAGPGILHGAKAATGMIARGIAKHPTLTSAAIGAAPGIVHGNPKEAAIGAALGTPLSRYVGRAAKALGGAAPRPAPKPSAMDMGKLSQPAPGAAPMSSSAATAQPSASVSPLQREVMAREPNRPINWREKDAVPDDAIQRDMSQKGGYIYESGESQIGLGERMAALLKVGTPEAMAEATQLAKALRQRGHIRTERAAASERAAKR